MVFTDRVRWADQGYPRRAVLASTSGLAALVVSGCALTARSPRWHPGPDPLTPSLTATMDLAARYDAAILALPALEARLAPLRDAHRAHAVALLRELGLDEHAASPSAASTSSPSPSSPAPADPAAILAALAKAERTGQQLATAACLSAPSFRAALLGSIAACRASHIEALR